MVGPRSLTLVPVLIAVAVCAQSWSPLAIISLPGSSVADEERQLRIALHGDRLAVGDPTFQGHGMVWVHAKNGGGSDTWDAVHAIDEGGIEGAAFGRAVAFGDEGLFVASENGLWQYLLGTEVVNETRLVDDSATLDIELENGVLVSSGPLVPGYEAAIAKMFLPDPDDGTYMLVNAVAIEPHSASIASCLGSVISFQHPYLIVADPCWSTTPTIPVSGLIKFFQVESTSATIFSDAEPATFGGYWPFGQGVYSGVQYGRALKLDGDTLFVGFGPTMSGMPAHVEVFRKNDILGWELIAQIDPPENGGGVEVGDLGRSMDVIGEELLIGTDQGLCFYLRSGSEWVFQSFEEIGGPVSSITHHGDRFAVAIPEAGEVHIYERTVTGIADGFAPFARLEVAPNPALEQAVVMPPGYPCNVRSLLISDSWGRTTQSIEWNGDKPLVIQSAQGVTGLSFLRAIAENGRTCGTARILWVSELH